MYQLASIQTDSYGWDAISAIKRYKIMQEIGRDSWMGKGRDISSDQMMDLSTNLQWLWVDGKDESHHVDTVEDDDGRCFTAVGDIGMLKALHAAAILKSWMKDVYDGSNQEYNDTIQSSL
ncbi:hypothetical protein O0I10_003448 [Lichtheimia ornata]|uniref:Uncharacterized protein n=1 Tax=Lichtheimia ornata TaxID=688661 RepID=A0AAD7V8E4_9FUNG|nr:uncharacterized protein O0I10_003448 [Lichtheimia ornata]KAJ8660805.1 hypothetical protein O0I10_003448 [Lichtheimia ornata]